MKTILFIASQDVRHQLRQGSTLVWLFVMPPIFFYFIGTVTSGFSSSISGGSATPLTVLAESPGFLQEQVHLRLADNDFAATWTVMPEPTSDQDEPARMLSFDPGLSDKILAEDPVTVSYDTTANALTRQFEAIRIQRSLYTALADIVIADAISTAKLDSAALVDLNNTPRIWQLDVAPAGKRQQIPSGFEQAVPGILVMFTLLVLLTSGASMLVLERKQGLLRRLASAPISKTEVISGKWGGRMVLAALQVTAALAV
ncbi:MAG: ABC transporter permease, partial [Gammaproteobacteria bacterium]|nr:ABC transporter permease [Gammaproteobacteria bacterium]